MNSEGLLRMRIVNRSLTQKIQHRSIPIGSLVRTGTKLIKVGQILTASATAFGSQTTVSGWIDADPLSAQVEIDSLTLKEREKQRPSHRSHISSSDFYKRSSGTATAQYLSIPAGMGRGVSIQGNARSQPTSNANKEAASDSPRLISARTGSPRNAITSWGGLTSGYLDSYSYKHDEKLWNAVCSGNVEEVRKAVYSGANVNASNGLGQTVLHRACMKGYSSIVEFLLENPEIRVNQPSHEGELARALDLSDSQDASVRSGRIECARLLLNHPEIQNSLLTGSIMEFFIARAVKRGDFDDYYRLRGHEATLEFSHGMERTDATALLFVAVVGGNEKIVQDLIIEKANVHATYKETVEASSHDPTLYGILADLKIANEMKPYDVALKLKRPGLLEVLVSNGAKPKKNFWGGYKLPTGSNRELCKDALKRGMKKQKEAKRKTKRKAN